MTNASKAKKLENEVFSILSKNSTSNITYSKDAINIAQNIIKNKINNFISSIDGRQNIDQSTLSLKPKYLGVAKYSNSNEPKCDIYFKTNTQKEYSISIKKSLNTYFQTVNNYKHAYDLFLGQSYAKYLTQSEFNLIDSVIKTVMPKLTKWQISNSQLKTHGGVSGYVNYHLNKNITKYQNWIVQTNCNFSYQQIYNGLVNAYTNNSTSNAYAVTMKRNEIAFQNMMSQIINNKPYIRELLFEMLSGQAKFNNTMPGKANYLCAPQSLYDLSGPDCLIVSHHLSQLEDRVNNNKSIGRVQNVPRIGFIKEDFKKNNFQDLLNSFPTADMSIKIGI